MGAGVMSHFPLETLPLYLPSKKLLFNTEAGFFVLFYCCLEEISIIAMCLFSCDYFHSSMLCLEI